MTYRIQTTLIASLLAISACSAGEQQEAAATDGAPAAEPQAGLGKPEAERTMTTAKISAPVAIAYRVIGEPVIGQPLTIDLRISSVSGAQPIRVDYRIVDGSALQLAESQLQYATVDSVAGDEGASEQVTVVPLREGRLYLNVAASMDTEQGAMSTVTAIPIQVGSTARVTEENGELSRDASGESVRVLDGSED
jgi:hypothetical protein